VAAIVFTDSGGATTLQSGSPALAARFRGWVPNSVPIGPAVTSLATGETFRLVYRTDHMASFALPELTPSQLGITNRLKIHLMNGGTCVLHTDDLAARVYTVRLAPGTEPAISEEDEFRMHSFSMVALNTAAAVMLCVYSGPAS
jgi:hypothetical protein